jgi:hypothetical protein
VREAPTRIALSCLAMLGFRMVISGQVTVGPPTTSVEATLQAKQMQVGVSEPQVLRGGGLTVKGGVVAMGMTPNRRREIAGRIAVFQPSAPWRVGFIGHFDARSPVA